jgi:hypothetical protein
VFGSSINRLSCLPRTLAAVSTAAIIRDIGVIQAGTVEFIGLVEADITQAEFFGPAGHTDPVAEFIDLLVERTGVAEFIAGGDEFASLEAKYPNGALTGSVFFCKLSLFPFQKFQKLLRGETIYNVFFRRPAAAGLGDAEIKIVQLIFAV